MDAVPAVAEDGREGARGRVERGKEQSGAAVRGSVPIGVDVGQRWPAVAWRLVVLVGGLFVFALGIVLTVRSGLGLGPWDVLHQGLSRRLGVSFGLASIGVGLVVLLVAWALGARPGFGTVANFILVGSFIDLIDWLGFVPAMGNQPWLLRFAIDALGVAVVGIGSALYIKAAFGAGPRDGLMLTLSRRVGGRVAAVRAAIELTVLAIGFLLGGTAGLGTLVFALGIGPAVGLAFRLFGVTVEGRRVEGLKVEGRRSG